MKKKICYAVLAVIMLVAFTSSYAYAANNGTVTSWYSDAYSVGYWSSKPYVFFTVLSSDSTVASNVTTAVNSWNSANIPCAVTTSNSMGNIKYYGGTAAQVNAVGYFSVTDNYAGYTSVSSSSSAGTIRYGLQDISVKKYDTVYACTLTSSSDQQFTTLHEMGHALGWEGHYTTSATVVMYDRYQSTLPKSLTSIDKTHLQQIYDIMN
ncbi:MAG: hypothetical protein ACI4EQ_10255 [Lachnospiraceae bacterium]